MGSNSHPLFQTVLKPGPAEIIRAWQKDSNLIKKLEQELNELVQGLFGQRGFREWGNYSEYVGPLIYFSLTSLGGLQTLGEEYAGILQIDKSWRKIPSKMALCALILLGTFGEHWTNLVLKLVETRLRRTNSNFSSLKVSNYLKPAAAAQLLGLVSIVKHYLPFLQQLHLALFYLNGTFYHFSKRLVGIQYLLVRRWYGNQEQGSPKHLKYLMWMSLINSILVAVNDSRSFIKNSRGDDLYHQGKGEEVPTTCSSLKSIPSNPSEETIMDDNNICVGFCTLCLERRRESCVTPCGHLFCWPCIQHWLRTKQICPICREQVGPSRVTPLQNYN